MKFPSTTLPAAWHPVICSPAVLLNPSTLAETGAVPPMVFPALPMLRPIALPRFAPAEFVPMKFPSTTLPAACAPVI